MKKILKREGYHANDRISWLMEQILEGQEKFEHPEKQSIYFQWGKENNRAVLNGYIHNYEKKREEFNRTSAESFKYDLNMVKAEMSWVREAKDNRKGALMPFIMLMGALCGKRDRLEIYVKVKEVTDKLPPAGDLKKHKEHMEQLKNLGV